MDEWVRRLESTDVDGLELEIILQSVLAALSSDSALLDASEGSLCKTHTSRIRTHHSVLESVRDTEDTTHVRTGHRGWMGWEERQRQKEVRGREGEGAGEDEMSDEMREAEESKDEGEQ